MGLFRNQGFETALHFFGGNETPVFPPGLRAKKGGTLA
jgi:hypothetical protein